MLFSESVYFLVLFTLPAALNIIYNVHIRQVPVVRQNKSVELAECVLFCMVVFFVNLIFMRTEILKFSRYTILGETERKVFAVTEKFDFLSFMIHYFILNLASSIAVIFVWHTLGQWAFREIKNSTNKAVGRDAELKYSDVWRNLFETEKIIDVSKCIVKIERGGQIVTAGLLRSYPAPTVERKELALYNTDSIRELFEEDKEKDVSDRIFPFAEVEYYDIETDTLIKFYKNNRYEAYYRDEPE